MELSILYNNYIGAHEIYKDIQSYLKGIPVDESNIAMRCHALSHMNDAKILYIKQFHGVHYTELNNRYQKAKNDYIICGDELTLQHKIKCERDLFGILY
jgi:hypothetical protein